MSKYLIVGGVAGGATAAARLRRLDEQAEIIMFERGGDVSFANCGLPYYVGGTIEYRDDLLVMDPKSFKSLFNVDVRIYSEVVSVNPEAKTVQVRFGDTQYEETYDALLLAPGAKPLTPPIPGIEHRNIVTLRNVPDADNLHRLSREYPNGKAVVVGGGFVGIESAENLRQQGLEVTVVEAAPHILAPFDTDMVSLAENELKSKGVKLVLGDGVKEFHHGADNGLRVELTSGEQLDADFVVLSIGVRPDTAFLQDSGIELNERGYIVVNESMQTNYPSIYAVGDAVQTYNGQTSEAGSLALAGPANSQGRLAADNMNGAQRKYRGFVGSSVLKVFDLTAASTGLNERALQRMGMVYGEDYRFTVTFPNHHASYYPGAKTITLKMIFSMKDGKVLGAQAIGQEGVDKRIDVIASVIRFGGTVQDLMDLELAYAPPFSSAKDPVNMAGYYADNIMQGLTDPLLPQELAAELEKGAVLIDVRSPSMFEAGHIKGAINIPAPKLRQQLSQLDKERPIIVSCRVGINGYYMERMLNQHGFKARNLMGGFSYARLFDLDMVHGLKLVK
ncbi:FAD-dependent pyridine nucleotide-disulfide oxidoreductase [Anaerovibrio sp. JC8]|uniref:FAD-dependent oxidoreductase n=1 Tax=Anaerovibrio sp. JC8 TaxID=1240085 RepID=UPI000A0A29FC|nr:FAD-dependent oxidoreductase [Anaerovibrio sp. JC8]ORT99298.1 FAD-dependent pyridine nucleotide-disulfide oxidoreductase [Anaerovibrio sp. JC8]